MIRYVVILLLLAWPLFFFRLGDRDLVSSHEARAAQNAQNMISTGDWSIPRQFNQRLDLQKPPLYYWLVAFVGMLNGGSVDPWVVRLPSAFSALGCMLLLLLLGCRFGRPRAGFLAALILGTSMHFTWLGRVGRIDMPFTFALTLATTASLMARHALSQGRSGIRWRITSYFAIAAAVMLKGPLALVLSLLWQACEWRLFDRSRLLSLRWHGWWGFPFVTLLVAPWFLWVNGQTENQLWEVFVLHHNFQRGMGTADTLASHPIWYYLPRLPLDLFPWSCFLPFAIWRFWKGKPTPVGMNPAARVRDDLTSIGAVWFACFLAFFSLMSFKRADYLLPLFPGAALFLGTYLDRVWLQNSQPVLERFRLRMMSGIVLATCVCWVAYLQWFDADTRRGWVWQEQGTQIRRATDMPVIFFRTEAHSLAFHVGKPLDTILEWENLDIWASRKERVYFVMPPDCADQWQSHLQLGKLKEVARLDDDSRPLVVLHSLPDKRTARKQAKAQIINRLLPASFARRRRGFDTSYHFDHALRR